MNRHQHWLENRIYDQHLLYLEQIRSKKTLETRAKSSRKLYQKKKKNLAQSNL